MGTATGTAHDSPTLVRRGELAPSEEGELLLQWAATTLESTWSTAPGDALISRLLVVSCDYRDILGAGARDLTDSWLTWQDWAVTLVPIRQNGVPCILAYDTVSRSTGRPDEKGGNVRRAQLLWPAAASVPAWAALARQGEFHAAMDALQLMTCSEHWEEWNRLPSILRHHGENPGTAFWDTFRALVADGMGPADATQAAYQL